MDCASNWKREKSVLEKLRHKNIMSLKAFDGRIFAMYVELLLQSLARGLGSPFSPSDAATILRGTSSALAYLVTQQVVHNDIKPANIAYSPERGAVLLDLGLAMPSDRARHSGGTPWYVPPDALDDGMRGAPGDIWALGVTMLYVLGKTRLPEKVTSGWATKDVRDKGDNPRKQMDEWIRKVGSARERLNRASPVEDLVHRMLERAHKRRIQAAQVFKEVSGRTAAGGLTGTANK